MGLELKNIDEKTKRLAIQSKKHEDLLSGIKRGEIKQISEDIKILYEEIKWLKKPYLVRVFMTIFGIRK